MSRFFNQEQEALIAQHIRQSELKTTGEIRVYLEATCDKDVKDRALEVFTKNMMHQTADRNGVLVYVAYESHVFYILGDEGIHARVGQQLWEGIVPDVTHFFKEGQYVEGICHAIDNIGNELAKYFPQIDPDPLNELPDDIIYGGE